MLFVKHYHPIPPPYGGVQVYVKRLMLSLCKRGLISGAFKGSHVVGIPHEYVKYLDTFPKHARSLYVFPNFLRLYKIFKQYQLIHTHASLSTCFGIWLIHKLQHKPVVYTIHNQMIDQEFSILFPWDRWCFKSLASSPIVQIITVNDNGKRMLLDRGIDFRNGIEVVPAYLPPVEIGSPEDYLSTELIQFVRNHTKFALFYAESFASHDGEEIYGSTTVVDAFIRAKQYNHDLSLVFCIANLGNDKEILETLREKIDKEGFSESVFWQVGALHEMWPLLKTATVLVRPTSTDGDSVMVREALAYGLPVITSDVTKRPDGCIVYHLGNLESLTAKLNDVYSKPYRKIYPQRDRTEQMLNIYYKLLQIDA